MRKREPKPAIGVILALTLLTCHSVHRELPRGVVEAVAPPYDPILLQAHLHGVIRLSAQVTPAGMVEHVEITESFWPEGEDLRLYEPYVMQWKFEPSEVTTHEQITFVYIFVPRDAPLSSQSTTFIAPATIEIRQFEPSPLVSH